MEKRRVLKESCEVESALPDHWSVRGGGKSEKKTKGGLPLSDFAAAQEAQEGRQALQEEREPRPNKVVLRTA